MRDCVKDKLQRLGYSVNTVPYQYIEVADKWYRNELIDDFHKRTTIQGDEYEIDRMNFAKRGCADDANMCEVINIAVGGKEQTEQVNGILNRNRFTVQYRKQLEIMAATGTVGAYIYLDNADYLENGMVTGGRIMINYCEAGSYIPLKIVNDDIVEAAFAGDDYTKNGIRTTLVLFTIKEGRYLSETYVFDNEGKEIEACWLILGDVKPFAVMRVAEVNNIRNMDGFGLPKVYNTVPTLKKLELCNMVLNGDLEKGEKLVLTNEAIVEIDRDTGRPKKKTPLMKKLFVFLGEKLPKSELIIQEYNPKIRIDEITKTFELCLSLFSMAFGFGAKKYTFENGQIKTATEYIGERQEAVQELNKQRDESRDYISGLIRAVMWFANTFISETFDLAAEISIDFDDSYIEDKNTRIDSMREDAQCFSDIPEFTIRYIMERLNMGRKEAMKIYQTKEIEAIEESED